MAYARAVIAVVVLSAGPVAAAGPCEQERGLSGLAVAPQKGVLAVSSVDPDSPAARSGVQAGDAVVQVNAMVPRTCAEYGRAVRDARREHKALLLLVRRGDAEVPLVVGADVWGPAPTATAEAAAPAARAPSAPPPPPPPLPPEVPVSVESVRADLGRLAPGESLPSYRRDVVHARRAIETLAARSVASPATVEELRTVARYFEGAEVAWDALEAERERQRRPRRLPFPDGATAPYFEDSAPAALIDEFPFLRATVAREPSGGSVVESSGLWRPLQARALLWDRGRDALDRLSARGS
jgi:hypothetical protein